jgi:hypothetical protein
MAIYIINNWERYFFESRDEGLGSSYERIVLNRKLTELKEKFNISRCLEAPVFGFTGVSGINGMGLARRGVSVSLVDHHRERLHLIEDIWKHYNLPVKTEFSEDYRVLPFEDNSFDLSWNFSALWFAPNLASFLEELTRVTERVIFIGIPNRMGMGYLSEKLFSGKALKGAVNVDNIVPKHFINQLKQRGWRLIEKGFIDVPWWPDIGMSKEDLLAKVGIKIKKKEDGRELNILNYYSGKEPGFEDEMMRHYWFEKYAPWLVKRVWAHHRFYVFRSERK